MQKENEQDGKKIFLSSSFYSRSFLIAAGIYFAAWLLYAYIYKLDPLYSPPILLFISAFVISFVTQKLKLSPIVILPLIAISILTIIIFQSTPYSVKFKSIVSLLFMIYVLVNIISFLAKGVYLSRTSKIKRLISYLFDRHNLVAICLIAIPGLTLIRSGGCLHQANYDIGWPTRVWSVTLWYPDHIDWGFGFLGCYWPFAAWVAFVIYICKSTIYKKYVRSYLYINLSAIFFASISTWILFLSPEFTLWQVCLTSIWFLFWFSFGHIYLFLFRRIKESLICSSIFVFFSLYYISYTSLSFFSTLRSVNKLIAVTKTFDCPYNENFIFLKTFYPIVAIMIYALMFSILILILIRKKNKNTIYGFILGLLTWISAQLTIEVFNCKFAINSTVRVYEDIHNEANFRGLDKSLQKKINDRVKQKANEIYSAPSDN